MLVDVYTSNLTKQRYHLYNFEYIKLSNEYTYNNEELNAI